MLQSDCALMQHLASLLLRSLSPYTHLGEPVLRQPRIHVLVHETHDRSTLVRKIFFEAPEWRWRSAPGSLAAGNVPIPNVDHRDPRRLATKILNGGIDEE
jgi:hypothetical protein